MKRNIYIFIVLSLALALPSCKIGKKYALPELDLPEEIVAGADTASIDSISWQSLYVDTTLQRLITIALDNNKDMKIAVAKVKEMIASLGKRSGNCCLSAIGGSTSRLADDIGSGSGCCLL